MTEKMEEFLGRLNELFLDFDINEVYPHANNIVFVSNHREFKIEGYVWKEGTPMFQGIRADYIPGAGTYERTK